MCIYAVSDLGGKRAQKPGCGTPGNRASHTVLGAPWGATLHSSRSDVGFCAVTQQRTNSARTCNSARNVVTFNHCALGLGFGASDILM